MLKSYKYRIYPTPAQRKQIDDTLSTCRFVYNIGLETKIRAWQSAKINLSAYDLQKQLTDAKKEFPWLRNAASNALDAALENVDEAFKSFFRGGGFPRFKNKKARQSFQCKNNLRSLDFDKQLLSISKIYDVPIVVSRPPCGDIRTVTISKTKTGKYFATILAKTSSICPAKPSINPNTTIGVDVGIKSFAVTSDGRFFEPNRYLKNSLKRLQCIQRRSARKKKGSNNRNKANKRVAIIHEKIANQRIDYIHKITTTLARDSQTESFVIENLNLAGMVKNRRVSQALVDVSFGEFFRQMHYKCEWYGKNLITIDRFAPSSKRCSDCGAVNDDLTLADRKWTCECGSHHDRDLNAAKNIKFFGLNTPVGSRGGPVESRRLCRAKKQEDVKSMPRST